MPLHVGLDSGATDVRRIAVDVRWGRVTVVPPPTHAAQVIASAPAAGLTFRALSFPFTDRRRLAVMVAQELEHSLGFPPGGAAWDFVARPPSPDGDNVYVVACAQSTVDSLLASTPPPAPTTVDAEPYAFQRVLAHAGVHEALVADFGARHTTFCRIRGGHLDYVRVLLRGGADIDAAIARQRPGTSHAQAETLKHDKGLALPEVSSFLERVLSDALLPPENADVPLFITGGGAGLKGLEGWLETQLGRPIRRMPVPDGVDPNTQAVAFGMALWGIRGGEGVNLHVAREKASRAPLIAALLVLILGLLSADVAVRRVTLSREIARNQEAIRTIAKNAAGVNSLAELESVLQARTSGQMGNGRNLEELTLSLAECVKEAEAKEKAGDLKIEEVVVGANEIRLRGSAASYPAVEALKNAVASHFTDVNVSSTQIPLEPGQTTARQGFTMVAPLPSLSGGATP